MPADRYLCVVASSGAECYNKDTFKCPPECGNGLVNSGEECDDGNILDGDGCSANCKIEQPPTTTPSTPPTPPPPPDDGLILPDPISVVTYTIDNVDAPFSAAFEGGVLNLPAGEHGDPVAMAVRCPSAVIYDHQRNQHIAVAELEYAHLLDTIEQDFHTAIGRISTASAASSEGIIFGGTNAPLLCTGSILAKNCEIT